MRKLGRKEGDNPCAWFLRESCMCTYGRLAGRETGRLAGRTQVGNPCWWSIKDKDFSVYVSPDLLIYSLPFTMDPFAWLWILKVSCWVANSFFCIFFSPQYFLERTSYTFAFLWLIFFSVWFSKVHPRGYQRHNFLISVLIFHGCVPLDCIYVPHLVSALICRWSLCWFFVKAIVSQCHSACWGSCTF